MSRRPVSRWWKVGSVFVLLLPLVTACGRQEPPSAPVAKSPAASAPAAKSPAEPAAPTAPAATETAAATSPAEPPTPPATPAPTPPTPTPAPADAPAPASAPETAASAPGPAGSLDDLRKTLATTEDGRTRVVTIDEIATLGQRAKPALPELVKATTDADPRPRWHAARAIGLIGEDAISAVPTLVGLLADPDPIVVTQAAAAIGLIRADDDRTDTPAQDAEIYAGALEPLMKTAIHADPRARRAALRAIKALRPPLDLVKPLFRRQLEDADPAVVMQTLHTLADMPEEALPLLLDALEDPRSRYWATIALAEIGPGAAAAVAPLAKIAADAEVHERMQAILALAAIGEPAAAAAPQIITALESGESILRLPAAYALGKIRAAAADEPLERADDEADDFLAALAAWGRARIHPDDAALVGEAVERLKKGLAHPDAGVRRGAVSALSDLEDELDDAGRGQLARTFAALIGDDHPDVALAAGAGLVRLGPAAVEVLEEKLVEPAHRLAALEILGALGPAAKPAVPEVTAILAAPEVAVRSDAALALAGIGSGAAEAVTPLNEALAASDDPGLTCALAYALGSIGPAAAPALDTLRKLATAPEPMVATVSVWAALKIDPDNSAMFETAVPLLRRAVSSDRELVRLEAAVALGDIGPAARSAIPILELAAEEDSSRSVRQAAAEALRKIRSNKP